MSARQERVALSRMASKIGCKSCGELAMAQGRLRWPPVVDEFGHPILQLSSGHFSVVLISFIRSPVASAGTGRGRVTAGPGRRSR